MGGGGREEEELMGICGRGRKMGDKEWQKNGDIGGGEEEKKLWV